MRRFWALMRKNPGGLIPPRVRRYLPVPLILVAGAVLSVSAHSYVMRSERFELDAALAKAARGRAELLQSSVLRSIEVLESLAALFHTHEVSRSEFRTFVS